MQVLNRKVLDEFAAKHADVREPLSAWVFEVSKSTWKTSADVKRRYAAADFISDNRVIFNLKGQRYRLPVRIHYDLGAVRILRIGTHQEYDDWDLR